MPGTSIIDSFENEIMNLENIFFRDLFSTGSNKSAHPVESLGMVGGLQMLLKALTANSETFFDNKSGFLTGQRVSLNGVTGVGQFDFEPVIEI